MIASAYKDTDENAAVQHAIREEFNECGNEIIAVASVMTLLEIARRMGVSMKLAAALKEAAKRHVRELWAFEENS